MAIGTTLFCLNDSYIAQLIYARTLSPVSDHVSTVRIWLDGSVVETFLDKRQAMTTRYYEPADQAEVVQVTWSGSPGQLKEYAVFQLRPISSDRLTT